ncbi:Phosphatidylglycerol/phosphatidylinositol transfer protein [Lachnellula hyalina]|uniref:Phosphatidylglycerol/phosphatidylinositol transfer protein n=1 Tax=Lachnellula hyalina TaxID=1316788 RepID=A0A8H8R7J8_9HELO|nr:Phosphatidylglycerol/phosphatidylinositol transfer protein [Lachnellula hyalina]TVY29477.1 Phosphatidylglycerol/phosphatidylinositol transfer protein [Lachnellula hyalina]
MKFSLAILSLFLSTLVASVDLSFFPGGQKVLDDKGEAVPGENPLTFCKADHGDDILELEHINLTPNPPLKGNTLTIEAVGTLKEKVEEGAYVILQVKYGLIRLVSTKADLCEQVSNVDMECPIEKGKAVITKDVELPGEIPPGKYTVFADAYTADGKKIVCLEATVQFD